MTFERHIPDRSLALRFSCSKLLVLFLSISSGAAIVLGLLGYGVVLSAEERFKIPLSASIATSELLPLGEIAVLQMWRQFGELSEWSFYGELWEQSLPLLKLSALTVAGITLIVTSTFAIQYFGRRWAAGTSLNEKAKRLVASHQRALIVGASLFLMATPPLVISVMLFGVLAALTLFVLPLSIAPTLGLKAGFCLLRRLDHQSIRLRAAKSTRSAIAKCANKRSIKRHANQGGDVCLRAEGRRSGAPRKGGPGDPHHGCTL